LLHRKHTRVLDLTSKLHNANPLLGCASTLKELISKILQNLKQVSKSLSQKL
jgi:hypothetical protein